MVSGSPPRRQPAGIQRAPPSVQARASCITHVSPEARNTKTSEQHRDKLRAPDIIITQSNDDDDDGSGGGEGHSNASVGTRGPRYHSPNPTPPPETEHGHMSNLEYFLEQTRCTECRELFAEPRILTCFHTFCLKCLPRCAVLGAVTCPICRHVTRVDPDAPRHSGTVTVLEHLAATLPVNLSAQLRLEGETLYSCAECSQEKGDVLCLGCSSTPYCASCHRRTHAPRSLQAHVTKPLNALPNSPSQPRTGERHVDAFLTTPVCSVHQDEPLVFFCQTCETTCCRDCVVLEGPHTGHLYAKCEEVSSLARRELSRWSTASHASAQVVDQAALRIALVRSATMHKSDDLIRAINEKFDTFRAQLDLRQAQLVEEVSTVTMIKAQRLRRQLENLECLLSRMNTGATMATQLAQSDVDVEILEMRSILDQAFKSLDRDLAHTELEPVESPDIRVKWDGNIDTVLASLGQVETRESVVQIKLREMEEEREKLRAKSDTTVTATEVYTGENWDIDVSAILPPASTATATTPLQSSRLGTSIYTSPSRRSSTEPPPVRAPPPISHVIIGDSIETII